jgi:hypothetical protein
LSKLPLPPVVKFSPRMAMAVSTPRLLPGLRHETFYINPHYS